MEPIDAHVIIYKLIYVSFLSKEQDEMAREILPAETNNTLWVNAGCDENAVEICDKIADASRSSTINNHPTLLVTLYDTSSFPSEAQENKLNNVQVILESYRFRVDMEVQLCLLPQIPVRNLSDCISNLMLISNSNFHNGQSKRLFLVASQARAFEKTAWDPAAALLDMLRRSWNPLSAMPSFGNDKFHYCSILCYDRHEKEHIAELREKEKRLKDLLGNEASFREDMGKLLDDFKDKMNKKYSWKSYCPPVPEEMIPDNCFERFRAKRGKSERFKSGRERLKKSLKENAGALSKDIRNAFAQEEYGQDELAFLKVFIIRKQYGLSFFKDEQAVADAMPEKTVAENLVSMPPLHYRKDNDYAEDVEPFVKMKWDWEMSEVRREFIEKIERAYRQLLEENWFSAETELRRKKLDSINNELGSLMTEGQLRKLLGSGHQLHGPFSIRLASDQIESKKYLFLWDYDEAQHYANELNIEVYFMGQEQNRPIPQIGLQIMSFDCTEANLENVIPAIPHKT